METPTISSRSRTGETHPPPSRWSGFKTLPPWKFAQTDNKQWANKTGKTGDKQAFGAWWRTGFGDGWETGTDTCALPALIGDPVWMDGGLRPPSSPLLSLSSILLHLAAFSSLPMALHTHTSHHFWEAFFSLFGRPCLPPAFPSHKS